VVRTPANDSSTPKAAPTSPNPSGRPAEELSWSPSHPAVIIDDHAAGSSRTIGVEASLAKLRQLKLDAIQSDCEGSLSKAEREFRDAFREARHRFGPTDSYTIKSAYQLASFFAKHSRMGDAYKTLQEVLDSLVEKWILQHLKTIKYLMHVVELHQAWGKHEDISTLLSRIIPLLQKYSDKNYLGEAHISRTENDGLESPEDDCSHVINTDAPSTEVQIDTYLGINNARLDFETSSFNHLVSQFIDQCKHYPEILATQQFEAQLMLIKDFTARCKFDEGQAELRCARQFMVELFNATEDLPPKDLLSASRVLAFMHLEFEDIEEDCERILSWVSSRLENLIHIYKRRLDNLGAVALRYLISIFLEYRRDQGYEWNEAAHWLERAYRLAVKTTGPRSRISELLEKSLKHQVLELEDEEQTPETRVQSEELLLSLAKR